MPAGNSSKVLNLIVTIGKNLHTAKEAISRYPNSTLVKIIKHFSSENYHFKMERYLVHNPISEEVLFSSIWQLIPNEHNLPLNDRIWDFDHLMNKHYAQVLNKQITETKCIPVSNIPNLIHDRTYLTLNTLGSSAKQKVHQILSDLNSIEHRISPTKPNCCQVEIRLCFSDKTYFAISYGFKLLSNNVLDQLNQPTPLKTYVRHRVTSQLDDQMKPNGMLITESASEVVEWLNNNLPELLLFKPHGTSIIQSEIKNYCSKQIL